MVLTPLNIRSFYVMLVVFLVSCGSKEDDKSAKNSKTKTLNLKAAVPGTSQEIPAYDPDGGGWEVEKWNHKINKSLKEFPSIINEQTSSIIQSPGIIAKKGSPRII